MSDNVDKLLNFLNTDLTDDNIKLMMTLMIVFCILALIFYLVESEIITAKFVMFFVVIVIFVYMYTNRSYRNRIDNLKKQIDTNSLSDVMTNMCNNSPDSDICKTFFELRDNYSNTLSSNVST